MSADLERAGAVIPLDRPIALPAPLGAEQRAVLGAVRRRRGLARLPLWASDGERIAELTRAVAYGEPAAPAPKAERRFVRLVAWNVQRGVDLPGLVALLRSSPVLREADALLLSEIDIGMARSGNRHVPRELGEALGMSWVFGNSYVCLDHGDVRDGPQHEANEIGLHGNAILSRWPLRRAESFSVAITRDKFHSSEKRLGHKKALWAELETPLGLVPVVAAHLDSAASPAQRAAQLRDIVDKAEERGLERVVIGGDLNTSTYDVKSVPRLLWNIASKMVRGGFPHAMHHYLHPNLLYERPVFDVLDGAGLDWRDCNMLGVGTSRYEVGSFESESKVTDQLPPIFVRYLAYKLRPWNGVAPFRIDWFATRGVTSAGIASVERPRWEGRLLSDHDPIVLDVTW